jgi:hypothetical protein
MTLAFFLHLITISGFNMTIQSIVTNICLCSDEPLCTHDALRDHNPLIGKKHGNRITRIYWTTSTIKIAARQNVPSFIPVKCVSNISPKAFGLVYTSQIHFLILLHRAVEQSSVFWAPHLRTKKFWFAHPICAEPDTLADGGYDSLSLDMFERI